MGGKAVHAAQCYKSRVLTRVIDLMIEIHSFDHQCLIIKGLLQSEQLKQHMITIGINQSLIKMQCMNIDVCKTLISYTNML